MAALVAAWAPGARGGQTGPARPAPSDPVERILGRLTLEQKIGQMLMVGCGEKTVTPALQGLLRACPAGAVVLFRHNIAGRQQVSRLAAALQRLSRAGTGVGLLIATDQEGGRVVRLPRAWTGPEGAVSARELGQSDISRTALAAERTAAAFRSAGLNMNLAPVLDVLTHPSNQALQGRTFGEEPERVTRHGCAYIRRLQERGVVATAKHFPGHGATGSDSHDVLPRVSLLREQWRTQHLAPFRAAVREAGVDAVMAGHVSYRFTDDPRPVDGGVPASLSPYFLEGVLRQELGFQGIVLTDDLNMAAVSRTYGGGSSVLQAVAAGADMLMISGTAVRQEAALRALRGAALSGKIRPERIDASVRRILRVKQRYGLLGGGTGISHQKTGK